jgi:hypothetical protein
MKEEERTEGILGMYFFNFGMPLQSSRVLDLFGCLDEREVEVERDGDEEEEEGGLSRFFAEHLGAGESRLGRAAWRVHHA